MPRTNIPSYRLHKPSGQAIVVLQGKMFYLGQYKSKASREKYNEIIADFLANGGKLPPTRSRNEITNQELAVRFLDWAKGYYVDESGKQTPTFLHCQLALSPLVRYYGLKPVSDFGPLSLDFLRDKWLKDGHIVKRMIDGQAVEVREDYGRKTINRWVAIIKQAFKWGVSRELVDASIHQALAALESLQAGRTKAPEYEKVETVADEVVDRTLPELPPIVRDMVQIQRLGGLRPQDVYNMRSCDIDRSRDVWVYRPIKHKTKYKGKDRVLAIGPKAQEIILPYIVRKADNPEAFLFSPRDSMRLYFEEKRAKRKSKVQPSQIDRSKHDDFNYVRAPQDQYTRTSYNRAIFRAVERINKRIEKMIAAGANEPLPDPLPLWSPNQLRHSAGTEIRDKYGLEYAQAVLGHSNAKTTEIYAEINFEKAAQVMREIG